MAANVIGFVERPFVEQRGIDCVEIYVPKSIQFLSELYKFLREKVTNRLGPIVLDGFSIYEVDGVFHGEKLWEQRTLVIRLMLVQVTGKLGFGAKTTVNDIGREIATHIAVTEEEIWICHFPQTLTVFRGLNRILR